VNQRDQSGVTLLELLIVVVIISTIAGISFPAMTASLAGLRLTSAAGSVSSFLTSALDRVDRRDLAAQIVVSPHDNVLAVYTAASGDKAERTFDMPAGITIEGDDVRRFLMLPGGSAPRMTIVLRNEKGARRSIRIDPATGVPEVSRLP
jgi:prepilin-type N-terminal cleavage/methylation domain-containing protein